MEESLQIRKTKAEARAADEKLVSEKRASKAAVCLASAIDPKWLKGPLIFDKVRIADYESEDV